MFRSLASVSLVLAATNVASAGLWTVGDSGNPDFYTVQDALGNVLVHDGDVLHILTGTYGGFDTGDKAITLEPGNSPGVVTFTSNVRVRSSATVNFEIAGRNATLPSGPTDYDVLLISGNLNVEGTLGIRLTNGFAPIYGDTFTIAHTTGTISVSGPTDLPTLGGGLSWNVAVVSGSTWFGGSGSSLVVSVVPAPGAAALVGLAGLATTRRRRA